MTTQQKIDAIIAVIQERKAIYAAVKAPVTDAAYNDEIVTGLHKGVTDKIADIFLS